MWVLRRRRVPQFRFVPPIVGLLTLLGLLAAGQGGFGVSLWRPIDLYGDGLAFRMGPVVLPFALLASAVFVSDWDESDGETELFGLAVVLVAISANNLLSLLLSWSLLAVWSNWRRRDLWQLAAVGPMFAAAPLAADPGYRLATVSLYGLSALLLGRGSNRPYLAALPAFAMLSRFGGGPTGSLLLGVSSVVLATLGGRRWLATGLVGFGLLATGVGVALAPGAFLATAIALVISGSDRWVSAAARGWIRGATVGSLATMVALLTGEESAPLLLIPAAALLAAPILSDRRATAEEQAIDWPTRLLGGWSVAVSVGILVWSVVSVRIEMIAFGVAGFGLAVLMAAGPGWLYRQPAYAAIASSALVDLRRVVAAVLNGFSALIVGINNVLEGEASTVWLLLILLIIGEGLLR